MKIFIPVFSVVAFPLIIISMFFIVNNWSAIVNVMEEKTHFTHAIEALKLGATIYRVDGHHRYGSEIRTSNGKTKTVYGSFDKNGDISSSLLFNEKDVMGEDWVIQWTNKGEK